MPFPFEENRNGWLSCPPSLRTVTLQFTFEERGQNVVIKDTEVGGFPIFKSRRWRCQTWFLFQLSWRIFVFFLYILWWIIWRCNSNAKCKKKKKKKKKSLRWSRGLCHVCSFAFHCPVLNQSLILFTLCFLIILLFSWYMEKKERNIYIYSIRPIRCFLSLTYFFMYRSICNTV